MPNLCPTFGLLNVSYWSAAFQPSGRPKSGNMSIFQMEWQHLYHPFCKAKFNVHGTEVMCAVCKFEFSSLVKKQLVLVEIPRTIIAMCWRSLVVFNNLLIDVHYCI